MCIRSKSIKSLLSQFQSFIEGIVRRHSFEICIGLQCNMNDRSSSSQSDATADERERGRPSIRPYLRDCVWHCGIDTKGASISGVIYSDTSETYVYMFFLNHTLHLDFSMTLLENAMDAESEREREIEKNVIIIILTRAFEFSHTHGLHFGRRVIILFFVHFFTNQTNKKCI